jgi:hypothetical protein
MNVNPEKIFGECTFKVHNCTTSVSGHELLRMLKFSNVFADIVVAIFRAIFWKT